MIGARVEAPTAVSDVEQQPVGEPPAEACLLRVLFVVVDRMVVAGHAREEHEVRVGQGLAPGSRSGRRP